MKKSFHSLRRLLCLAIVLCLLLPGAVVNAESSVTVAFLGHTSLLNPLKTPYSELLGDYLEERLEQNVNVINSDYVELDSDTFMNQLVQNVLPQKPDAIFVELNVSKQYKVSEADMIARLESMILAMTELEKVPAVYFIYLPQESMLDNRTAFDRVAKAYGITVLDVFSYLERQYRTGALRTMDFLTAGEKPSESGQEHIVRAAVNELEKLSDLLAPAKTGVKALSSIRYTTKEILAAEAQMIGTAGTILYVAANGGNDTNAGTIDAPLATVGGARDRIRAIKKRQGEDFAGATVYLREGVYHFPETLTFTKEDSGTSSAGVVYSAYKDEKVRFTNATKLNPKGFKPVTDVKVLERFHTNGLGKILQLDLTKAGIQPGKFIVNTKNPKQQFDAGHWGNTTNYALGNLFIADEILQERACYPNGGYMNIASHQDTSKTRFAYSDTTAPERWNTHSGQAFIRNITTYGYFTYFNRFAGTNAEERYLNLAGASYNGGRAGWVWNIVNLLEELDVPGEWCVEEDTGVLYYYPDENFENSELLFTSNTNSIVKLDHCKNITLQNIIIEGGCGIGVEIIDGIGTQVKGCTLRNLGKYGVYIQNSGNANYGGNGVLDSHFYNIANGGVYLAGGDLATLTETKDYVRNCHFEDYSTMGHHGSSAVWAQDTVGVYVENCFFHNDDAPAISLTSNNLYVKGNEFSNLMKDSDDTGALYGQYRGQTAQGHYITNNYFHDIEYNFDLVEEHSGVAAIYPDAMSSFGIMVTENVFQRVDRPFFGTTSSNQTVDGNLFMDSDQRQVYAYQFYSDSQLAEGGAWLEDKVGNGTLESYRGKGSGKLPSSLSHLFYNAYLENTYFSGDNQKNYFRLYPWLEHSMDGNYLQSQEMLFQNNAFYMDEMTEPLVIFNYGKADKGTKGNYNYNNYIAPDSKKELEVAGDPYVRIESLMMDAASRLEDFNTWDVRTAGLTDEPRPVGEFTLISPANGQREVDVTELRLTWNYASGADEYLVQVAVDPEFKNVVFEGTTRHNYIAVPELEFGVRKYYWQVEAKSFSKSFTGAPVSKNGPYSFSSMRFKEAYKGTLGSIIENAKESLAEIIEGTEPGRFRDGTKAGLEEAITKAERVYNALHATQEEVDAASAEMRSAHISALSQIVISEFDLFEVFKNTEKISNVTSSGELMPAGSSAHYTVTDKSVTVNEANNVFYSTQKFASYEVAHFTFKIDFAGINAGGQWGGIGIGLQDRTYRPWQATSYAFYMRKEELELQGFKIPTGAGGIYECIPNTFFEEGKEYDVEFCAVPHERGRRIILRVDGQIAFDYIDATNYIENPGYLEIYSNLTGGGITVGPARTDCPYPTLAELLNDPESELNQTKTEE